MKLESESQMLFMLDRHDRFLAIVIRPGNRLKMGTQGFWVDHQTVVTRGDHGTFDPFENTGTCMVNLVRLAVHQFICSNDLTASRLADRLMAQADSKQRQSPRKVLGRLQRDPSLLRSTRARRNNQMGRIQLCELFDRNVVVPKNSNAKRRVDLSQSLHDVVGKGIVVVDNRNHRRCSFRFVKLSFDFLAAVSCREFEVLLASWQVETEHVLTPVCQPSTFPATKYTLPVTLFHRMEASEMTQTGSNAVNCVPLLDVNRENGPISNQIKKAIGEIVDSGWFIGGPNVAAFEKSVAELCETEFAIGCASGSDALLLALMAVGVEAGDEVICPSFTFFATASCISRLGATPVFVDIEPHTFNVSTDLIAAAITPKTKAIIPVHLFGQCCDIESINELAAKHDIHVVEDCAQSIGASIGGRMAGSMGAVGCFSFYPTKNLGGMGDAGIITTNDAELADRIRLLANHGMRPRYYHQEIGINSRLDAIQAAVLKIKLGALPSFTAQRSQNAERYRKLFNRTGISASVVGPIALSNCNHVWNQFTIRVPNGQRDWVRAELAERKIGAEIYYPVPLHRQECFAYLGEFDLPETDRAAKEVLSIPIFPGMTKAEQDYVVGSLAEILLGGTQRIAA